MSDHAALVDRQGDRHSFLKITDAWDDPYRIVCEDDETTVVSAGPDKKEGTADDIRVPEAPQPAK